MRSKTRVYGPHLKSYITEILCTVQICIGKVMTRGDLRQNTKVLPIFVSFLEIFSQTIRELLKDELSILELVRYTRNILESDELSTILLFQVVYTQT